MASAKGPGAGLENLLYWGGDETSIRGERNRMRVGQITLHTEDYIQHNA